MLSPVDPDWISMLRITRRDFYLLPGYVALTARFDGGEPVAILVEDGPRRLLMPLLLRDVPAALGGPPLRDATSPYGYPGITVSSTDLEAPADAAFTRDAVAAAIAALREAGVVSLFLRLNALLPVDHGILGDFEVLVSHGNTVSIDLLRDEASLLRDMRDAHRRNIARLDRLGFTYQIDPTCAPESITGFLQAYMETMDRLGASSSYYLDADYLREFNAALGGRMIIVLVRQEGVVTAAAPFTEVGRIVQYHLGGTGSEVMKMSPIKGIFSVTAHWAKSRGNRIMHLGGRLGRTEDALFNFKAGFSPERHMFQTARIVIDQPAYADLSARWEAQSMALAPEATAFFPAYRALLPAAVSTEAVVIDA